jgi:hypothetical protein
MNILYCTYRISKYFYFFYIIFYIIYMVNGPQYVTKRYFTTMDELPTIQLNYFCKTCAFFMSSCHVSNSATLLMQRDTHTIYMKSGMLQLMVKCSI